MASLGESSLGSVPIPNIAALQSHLLQNGKPSADARAIRPHAESTKHDESSPSQAHLQSAHDQSSKSVDASPAPGTTVRLPPRLTPSRSAPAGIDAMIQHDPPQDTTMTRPFSFHGYAGGDTQPMESQVYRDYTESMTRSSGTTPKKTILRLDEQTINDENTYEPNSVNGRTQHTMDKDDEGYVDLDFAWQAEDSPTAKSTTSGIEELLAGPETQSQNNIGANGSFAPRTPGMASDKRRRSGDIPTSATDASRKTPGGFSQMFGMATKMPALSATQLFDQTQAQSSPMLDTARSDPIGDRPSPNMNTNGDLSPDAASSSPVLMMRNPPASTAGEPRDTYTSMRESQERRAARLRQDLHLDNRFGPGAIAELAEEEEEDTQQIRMERQRLQRVMSDQAMDEWNKYRAPSRPGHRSVSAHRKTTTIDLVTPGTLRKQGRVQFDLSDDEQEIEDEGVEMELPVETEDTHDGEGVAILDGAEDGNDDDDVYDEYGQTVLRSQRDPDDEDEEVPGNDDDNAMQDDDFSNEGDYDDRDEPEEDVQMRDAEDETADHVAGTQPAVADSQPERLEAQRSLLAKEPSGQPATSSIIPGSQYVGATSQELARHSNRIPNSSTLTQQAVHNPTRSQPGESRVPSSPPGPAISSADQEENSSNARQELSTKRRTQRNSQGETNHGQREIPESDQPEYVNAESAQKETLFETAVESNVPAPFSTAQTHLEESERTPEKPRLVKEMSKVSASQQSMPTPLKAAAVRRFADIAADPSPPEYSGESQLDMDAIIGNVISMDDQNFMDVLSSPPSEKPTKRRRLMNSEPSRRRSRLPSMEIAGSEVASESAREPSSSAEAARATSAEPAQPAGNDASVNLAEALRSSPKKANQIPSATPEKINAPDTPESVRKWEEAGAKAASQLLSTRPLPGKASKSRPTKLGRQSSASREPEHQNVKRRASSKLQTVVEKPMPEHAAEYTAVPPDDATEHTAETRAQVPQAPSVAQPTQALTVDAPERVLAWFRGASYNAFYPATWLGRSADGKGHVIRFDDTTVTTLADKDVRALELRVGDGIKIDYEGYRSKTWLVKSFGRKALNDDDRANGVDIYGHVTLHVQAKVTQRNSMPAPGVTAQGEGNVQEIMVTHVKITRTMLHHYDDRHFHPPDVNVNPTVRRGTPSVKEQSPGDETPSRTRRATASTTKSIAKEPSKLREESVASSSNDVAGNGSGMFEGMAFAISYASNETEKFDVTNLIRRNGGRILEQGFDELFVAPQLDEQTTPTKRSGKPSGVESGSLKLKPEYESLGFMALIADKHSRRAKYMQALALEIPTLSGRWVIDSFDSSRNDALPAAPRPWTRYLLPAGESSYLGGAIRSRTLQYYNPSSVRLPVTVNSRALLLGGAGVLLVAPKKGKGTWERRKAYAFLTLALGAGSVRRVADLAEAKKLLASDAEKQTWEWVYVDDDVCDAAKNLFGSKGPGAGGRKRKRNEGPQMCVEGMQGRVKVVGDEFVIQSLILGALVD